MDECIVYACKKIVGALLLGEFVRLIGKEIYKKGERDYIDRIHASGYKVVDGNGNVVG